MNNGLLEYWTVYKDGHNLGGADVKLTMSCSSSTTLEMPAYAIKG